MDRKMTGNAEMMKKRPKADASGRVKLQHVSEHVSGRSRRDTLTGWSGNGP